MLRRTPRPTLSRGRWCPGRSSGPCLAFQPRQSRQDFSSHLRPENAWARARDTGLSKDAGALPAKAEKHTSHGTPPNHSTQNPSAQPRRQWRPGPRSPLPQKGSTSWPPLESGHASGALQLVLGGGAWPEEWGIGAGAPGGYHGHSTARSQPHRQLPPWLTARLPPEATEQGRGGNTPPLETPRVPNPGSHTGNARRSFPRLLLSAHATPWGESRGAEKAFDKIQHLFLITTLQNVSLEGTYLNIRKAIYDTPRAAILLSSEKRKVFPWRADTRPGCLLSSLPFNLVLEVLARAVREEEEMQGIPVGKEGVGCPYLKMT
ncbi:uncharacterized protein LOC110258195 [Sus scrofa]|uniref:uncharacterized protein LOC110258195 n=1 Tax=Sus scrofa TaxID=9823 RepID=UPI000A2B5D02|nr:uncharacterized protein LOC110258195 [Sus scrofa]